MNFIVIGLLLLLILCQGKAVKFIINSNLSAITLGFMVLVASFSALALPFSLFNLSVSSFLVAGNILLIIMSITTLLILWNNKEKMQINYEKVGEWIKQNWFVLFIIIISIGILFIDYYPTVYSVSNTDDTTYIGGQQITQFFNQIDPTSGFAAQNVSIVQKIVTWRYVWMYFSELFSINILVFNRFILGIIMPIIFYFGVLDGLKLLTNSKKHTQYLLLPLLVLFVYPIFSDDAWGQIHRIIYMPWFASAYSFIVYPFLVISFYNNYKNNFRSFFSIIIFIGLALFGIMMHQVNVFVLLLLGVIFLIFNIMNYLFYNKIKYIVISLASLNIMIVLISTVTQIYQNYSTYMLPETALLINDVYTFVFFCTLFFILIGYIYLRIVNTQINIKLVEWLYFGINLIILVISFPLLYNVLIKLTGGYEFATRRIVDVFIFLAYILLSCIVFKVIQINKKSSVFFLIIFILAMGYTEMQYENKMLMLLPKIEKIKQYPFLNPLENPSRIHPLLSDVNSYFENEEMSKNIIFGPNYIYSGNMGESLYFTPTLTLLNKNIKVINDIRNGMVTSEQKQDLEILSDYFRCEQNICLEIEVQEMIKLFEKLQKEFNITHIIISPLNNNQVENPLYKYFHSKYEEVHKTKKYDFTYDFSIFEVGE